MKTTLQARSRSVPRSLWGQKWLQFLLPVWFFVSFDASHCLGSELATAVASADCKAEYTKLVFSMGEGIQRLNKLPTMTVEEGEQSGLPEFSVIYFNAVTHLNADKFIAALNPSQLRNTSERLSDSTQEAIRPNDPVHIRFDGKFTKINCDLFLQEADFERREEVAREQLRKMQFGLDPYIGGMLLVETLRSRYASDSLESETEAKHTCKITGNIYEGYFGSNAQGDRTLRPIDHSEALAWINTEMQKDHCGLDHKGIDQSDQSDPQWETKLCPDKPRLSRNDVWQASWPLIQKQLALTTYSNLKPVRNSWNYYSVIQPSYTSKTLCQSLDLIVFSLRDQSGNQFYAKGFDQCDADASGKISACHLMLISVYNSAKVPVTRLFENLE